MAEQLIDVNYKGEKFQFLSTPQAPALIQEIFQDNYKVFEREIDIEHGDTILDIGACEGMFSVMMGRMFPEVRVLAFEPVARTFQKLVRNIELNGVTNVEPFNFGVGPSAGKMEFSIGQGDHSGGSSGVMTFDPLLHDKTTVDIKTLDDILEQLHSVKLMKMDVEGMEYEAIYPSRFLEKVENVVMEIHTNKKLQAKLFSINELATYVGSKTNLVFYQPCYMAE
jgi:FkbM family methyltransferase